MHTVPVSRPESTSSAARELTHPLGETREVADGVACVRTAIVNVYLCGPEHAGDRGWVLVDAGMPGSAARIRTAAAKRFGAAARPSAIVLTHGHFDHVGALEELADEWDVPVYVHPLELPYLTGRTAYPAPDPTVGGGAMAVLSFLYPRGPIDIGTRARELPANGTVPGLPEWRWVHTPGHAPGHVSLFRERDRCLLAGDAVITVKQESALAVWTQRPELHGPPTYFTPDWGAAAASARVLAALDPEILASGHGLPLSGRHMRAALDTLASGFEQIAVPPAGRYVDRSRIAVRYGDPRQSNALLLIAGAALVGAAGSALTRRLRRR
jgi:glyoxylase-like metal-dependent hydrolase (beta-lactamase superfamily II)